MPDIYQESLDFHRRHHGKLAVAGKAPLHDKHDLSLAYTPGVAEVCRAIAADKAQVRDLTIKKNTVAVITDGSAILGLGNLGPEAALPVMEGKCLLFKEFADVDAWPICLATQDTEEIIKTVKLIAPVFGGVNLEDISAPRCFEIEKRLKAELDIPVMHDDQHGTATVVLAGLINALKVTGRERSSCRLVISGAGAAGIAVTQLLLQYGFSDITICDTKGAIYDGRSDLSGIKADMAKQTNPQRLRGGLADVLEGADIFVGVSAPGILSADAVRKMAVNPIIFSLSNPVPEIMPEEAAAAGAAVVATGRSDFPNQINNVLVFPGVFRGALDNGVRDINSALLIRAAESLAALVPEPRPERILPDPLDRSVALAIAAAIK